jgi:hypothetical protein
MTNFKIVPLTGNKPANDREMAELCKLVGRPLPQDYSDFLRAHGKCTVDPYTFMTSCPAPMTKRDLRDFLAFTDTPDSIEDIRGMWNHTRSAPGMLDSWLPFATEYTGGLLCLDTISGCVYFRDYTFDYPVEQALVALSFSAFIGSLFSDDEEESY